MSISMTRLAGIVSIGALLICPCFGMADALAQSAGGYTIDSNWIELPNGEDWNGSTSWVAPDGHGNVLVLVRAAPYFRLFTKNGRFIRSWGEDGQFLNAHSVTFDSQGFIWATDAASHVVYKYSPAGEIVMTLGTKGVAGDNASHDLFNQVNHVAFAANGDIYVSDGYENSRIVHFTKDGEFVRIIGGVKGSGPGELQVPHGVAIDSRGRILVNDSGNQRVAIFGQDGRFIEAWPFPSRGGIAVASDDTVYVSDVNAGAVNVLRDGKLIESIEVDARAHGLGLDTDGTIYVSDARGRKVVRISKAH
jgi:peptidylamidoglycolate lyase